MLFNFDSGYRTGIQRVVIKNQGIWCSVLGFASLIDQFLY